jgi:hypothetical protein
MNWGDPRCLLGGLQAAGLLASLLPLLAYGSEQRVGLRGYDPVNYFTEGRPAKGSPEFTASFDNVTYWFKGADNQSRFVKDPDHYAPQFKGFCAIDLSRGLKTEPDPEAWTIAGGKLYVFGKMRGHGVFAESGPEIVAKATKNWTGLAE